MPDEPQVPGTTRSAAVHAWPVFLAFLAMGFGDAAGPFVSLAKAQFQLSNFAAQLIPFAGFLMFALLSVPMGLLQDRRGRKNVLLLGIVIMLAGVLVPAIGGLSTFGVFLVTVVLLGAGATTLQVSGNPIMRDVSPEGKFARNLSLAQFVKAVGSLSGPLIPVIGARYFGVSWQVIFPVYSVALIVTLICLLPMRVQERREADQRPATAGDFLRLLGNPKVAMMVAGIFFYVGAEVSVSSAIPLYLQERFAIDVNRTGLLGTGIFFLALTIGRFSGGVILNWIQPRTFFRVTALVSLAGLGAMFLPSPAAAVVGFIVIGLGFANIFPLIFSLAVDAMPEHTNELSGLMVMAIVGGAVLPPSMGLVADALHSVQASFAVPLAALVYIAWVSLVVKVHPAK